MINFIYPTITEDEDTVFFTGCGYFSTNKKGNDSFNAADDDDLEFISRVFSILFPGWLKRDPIFDILPKGLQEVQGFSKGLAYFLTLAKLSKSLRPDILDTGKNVWCTGVIHNYEDEKPILNRVDPHFFDVKLAAFLSEEENPNSDFLFIAPESNIRSEQEKAINNANAKLYNLSDLKNKKHLSFKQKTVLIVNADQLKDIVNFLFIKNSKKKLTPTKKAYAVLMVIFVLFFFFNDKILTTLKFDEYKKPLDQLNPEIIEVLQLAYNKKLVYAPIAISATIRIKSKIDKSAWIPMQNGDILTSNDRYQIVIFSNSSAHIYVLQIDSQGKLDWLFPSNSFPYSRGKNPIPEMEEIHIPSKNETYFLDDNQGVEHLYIIATKNRWTELEEKLSELGEKTISETKIKVAFQKGTRGVGGITKENENFSLMAMSKESIKNVLESKDGVVVIETWFNRTKDAAINTPNYKSNKIDQRHQLELNSKVTANGVGERPRIAILFFENNSPDNQKLNQIVKQLPDMIFTDLMSTKEYEVVEREHINRIIKEQNLSHDKSFDKHFSIEIGRLVGAEYVIIGSALEVFKQFQLMVRLISVKTGIVEASYGITGKIENFDSIRKQLIKELVTKHIKTIKKYEQQ